MTFSNTRQNQPVKMKTRTKTFTPSNVTTTRCIANKANAAAIVNRYIRGESMDAIAASFSPGVGTVAIRTLLVVNGVAIRRRGRYARGQFANA